MKETKYSGYFVDKKGNVYSSKANKGHLFKQKIPQKSNSGYLYVSINNKMVYIHRLVAETFIENPENKPQVNHKDFNKENNCVENLEWVTQTENINHLKDNNPCKGKTGSNSGYLFEGNNLIQHFRSLQKAKEYCRQNYGCTLCTIGSKNVNWRHSLIYIRDCDFPNFDIFDFWTNRDAEIVELKTKQDARNKDIKGFGGSLYEGIDFVKDFDSIREASTYINSELKNKGNGVYSTKNYIFITKRSNDYLEREYARS